MKNQPWLADPTKETWLILAPSILPVALIFLFNDYFLNSEVSSLWWLILVLCIDVSHVYSTLFRMYWDRATFAKYKRLLIMIPIVGFIAGATVHLYSAAIFWRILAYVAVFHFVRQQYGFMRLYSRKEIQSKLFKFIDSVSIYNATLYPLIYWHINLTGKLSWFVKGDFISFQIPGLDDVLFYIFLAILAMYILKEIWIVIEQRAFNIPKNMIMIGTYASWYVGIVAFQGDLIFTLLNVVAHGIPYMGLIWIYGEKKSSATSLFGWRGALIFIAVLIAFAYVEEGLWDVLVWKDHTDIFPFFTQNASLESSLLLSIIVPLLVLPQITHYVLDGFIWRFSKDSGARI
jgi:hypothetical protein